MVAKNNSKTTESPVTYECHEIDVSKISSPVLAELIEEVRNEDSIMTTQAYDRTHNRHNRGR